MSWEQLAKQAYEESRGVLNTADTPMKVVAWERLTREGRMGWIRAVQKTIRTFVELSGIPWPDEWPEEEQPSVH